MKRKRLISILVASCALVFGVTTSVAFAVDSTNSSTNTRMTANTTADVKTTNQVTAQTTTLSDADKKKMQERLNQRKTELKTKLTTAQKTRIQTKCKAAQGLIGPIREKVKTQEKGRAEVYGGVVAKLTDLSVKLKAKGIVTTELDASVTTLQGKVTTFKTDIEAYKQAVSDLTDMECATDPDAFQASLLASRTALEKVNKDAADIRSYIKDTIKPILAKIKTELATKKSGNQ